MTKERIESIREILLPFVAKKLKEINYEGLGESDAKEFTQDFNEILNLAEDTLEPKRIPEDLTNGQMFIHVFGINAWKQMIKFSNLNNQFREFWNAPYKAESEV